MILADETVCVRWGGLLSACPHDKETFVAMTPGARVKVRTAFGQLVEKRAVTGVVRGDAFDVVRVCSEDEWESAARAGQIPHGSPWPAEDVELR